MLLSPNDNLYPELLFLVCAELLFMSCIDLGILRWADQSLGPKTDVLLPVELQIICIDVNVIVTDLLDISSVFMFVLLCLRDQVLSFIVWIPADAMQVETFSLYRDTVLSTKLVRRSRHTANGGSIMTLHEVDNVDGYGARLGVHHNNLIAVQLAEQKKLLPPTRLQARKPSPSGNQGTNSSMISLQRVELEAYEAMIFSNVVSSSTKRMLPNRFSVCIRDISRPVHLL